MISMTSANCFLNGRLQISSAEAGGTPNLNRSCFDFRVGRVEGNLAKKSPLSKPLHTSHNFSVSSTLEVRNDTQSWCKQAGETPLADTVPLVGLNPQIPLNIAGTRIEPAVSLPRENDTSP